MRELNDRDLRKLTKAFLEKLNYEVNGDEDKCIESKKIFEATGLGGYGSSVIPAIVQELAYEGFIKECGIKGQVKITRKGKNRLNRTIDSNISLVLQSLAIRRKKEIFVSGQKLQELTDLTPAEINDAIATLEEVGLVKTQEGSDTNPFTFHRVEITPRGLHEYQRQIIEQSPRAEGGAKKLSLPPTPVGSPYGLGDSHRKKKQPSKINCSPRISI
jgi:predicted transcriptional regulator